LGLIFVHPSTASSSLKTDDVMVYVLRIEGSGME
jgi:hypothetical protein